MFWAITNLTGHNRVTKALAVRYSAIPLNDTSSTTSTSPSTSSSSQQHRGGGGGVGGQNSATSAHHDIILPLDVEETVTCFCRMKNRKKEKRK